MLQQALKKEKKEEKEKEEGERRKKKGKSWDPALPALHGKDRTTFRRDQPPPGDYWEPKKT